MKQNRIFLSPPHLSGDEIELVKEAFESNYVAPLGPMVKRFEENVCAYTGFKHAVALSSGTAAIHLSLLSLGISSGDHVWASDLTFIGSISSILFCGAIPTFIDASHKDWNIDIDLLEEALGEASIENKLPKAIIVTDLYGQPCDHDRLNSLGEKYGVEIICDAAESLGASYKEKKCYSKTAIYSFNGNKIITTSGGGMLVSNDKRVIDYSTFLSQQARDNFPYYHHTVIGNNYRMSNILAAIGVGQLKVLDERIKKRKEIYEYYKSSLSSLQEISFMPIANYGHPNYWLTVMYLDSTCGVSPEDLRQALENENIEARPVWKPMHLQPVFAKNRIIGGDVSKKIFATGLCLPSGTSLKLSDQDRIIEIIRKTILKKNKGMTKPLKAVAQ